MNQEIFLMMKDEAYTYDELSFLAEKVLPFVEELNDRKELEDKLTAFTDSLKDKRDRIALFFMPEASFQMFSLLTGDNSISCININDIKEILTALNLVKDSSLEFMKNHLSKKLEVLYKYLEEGNGVKPVPIQADNLERKRI
jgi:hypothetical protein